MNSNGYIIELRTPFGGSSSIVSILGTNLFYTTSDCAGNAYVQPYLPLTGAIYSNNGLMYYLPKNAGLPVPVVYNSQRYESSECQLSSGTLDAYRVFLNDPSITGESSITKTPPVRIIRRTQ